MEHFAAALPCTAHMMRVDVVTLFPAMFDALSQHGVTGRAIQRGVLQLHLWNVRDYAHDRHRTVDDRPYGGGPGMVMQVQPLRDAIHAARAADTTPAPHRDVQVSPEARPRVIYLSPQGRRLDQAGVRELAAMPRIICVAGRYEGIDERVLQAEVDEEWSIGDYVLSGGELAAMVMIDAVTRLLPGVLGHEDSAQQDSFGLSPGGVGLLDYPHYTRPEEIDGMRVPEVLLSGDHQAIARWRQKQALGRTWLRRPDLLEARLLSPAQKRLLDEYIQEYYGSASAVHGCTSAVGAGCAEVAAVHGCTSAVRAGRTEAAAVHGRAAAKGSTSAASGHPRHPASGDTSASMHVAGRTGAAQEEELPANR